MTLDNQNNSVHIYGETMSNFVRTVMLVCEYKAIPYTYGFNLDEQKVAFKSEQHIALHPYGKIPVLIDQDFALAETSSICRYLDNNFIGAKVQFQHAKQAAYHDAFCAIASIDIDKAILRDFLVEFAFPKGANGTVRMDVVKAAIPGVHNALTVIDNELASNNMVINGDQFSIADALLAPMLHYINTVTGDFKILEAHPQVQAYLTKLLTHECCKKVLL
jgi:glutathione S-transferase